MSDWQITAKTIACEEVDDEVTLLIYKDGTAHCTGFKKYTQPNAVTAGIIKEKSRRLKRPLKCEGEACAHLTRYKDKIMAEETK